MARVFTDADKKKQAEILKQSRQKKKEEKVSITIDNFIIESYEYGWLVAPVDNPLNKHFYCTLTGICKHLLSQKLRKSSAHSVEELLSKIEALFDFKDFLEKKVTF